MLNYKNNAYKNNEHFGKRQHIQKANTDPLKFHFISAISHKSDNRDSLFLFLFNDTDNLENLKKVWAVWGSRLCAFKGSIDVKKNPFKNGSHLN